MLQKLFTLRHVFLIALIVALGALGAALVAQFGFAMKPCILCLWQRLPYVLIILFAAYGLAKPSMGNYALAFLLLCFLASFGLALFHVGVEEKWWVMVGGCPVESASGKSEEQLLAELLTTPLAPCDKVAWRLWGYSITVWNTVLSLSMACYLSIVLLIQNKHEA